MVYWGHKFPPDTQTPYVSKDLFMWLFVRMHLFKYVPACHHMSIQKESANVIVLSDKTNTDDISVSDKM